MKLPAGHISQQRFQSALKRISRSGTYSSAIKKSFNTVAGGKYRSLKYRSKISRQQGTAFIDDYKKDSGLASVNKEGSERTFNRAIGAEKKESQQHKIETNRARFRMDKIRSEISGWRNQGQRKQAMSLTDLRKKSGAIAGQTPATTKPGDNKTSGIAAKIAPSGGAVLKTMPRVHRASGIEAPETHPVSLKDLSADKTPKPEEESKLSDKKDEPTDTKTEKTGDADDMMLD